MIYDLNYISKEKYDVSKKYARDLNNSSHVRVSYFDKTNHYLPCYLISPSDQAAGNRLGSLDRARHINVIRGKSKLWSLRPLTQPTSWLTNNRMQVKEGNELNFLPTGSLSDELSQLSLSVYEPKRRYVKPQTFYKPLESSMFRRAIECSDYWITVFGFPDAYAKRVQNCFSCMCTIAEVRRTSISKMQLKFLNSTDFHRALSLHGRRINNFIIGVYKTPKAELLTTVAGGETEFYSRLSNIQPKPFCTLNKQSCDFCCFHIQNLIPKRWLDKLDEFIFVN